MRLLIVATLVVLWLGSATAQESPARQVRQDPATPHLLAGNLTWDGSRGGIVWTGDPASQDRVLTQNSVDAGVWGQAAQEAVRDATSEPPAPDVFTSEPLPFNVHLNVSRHIELDILVQGSCRDTIDAEVLVGEGLVAGALAGQDLYPAPSTPQGWTLCVFRMAPEVRLLEQGERVTVRLTYLSANNPTLGMSREHRSHLRLPFYPLEEVVFRYPQSEASPWEGLALPESIDRWIVAPLVSGMAWGTARRSTRRASIALIVSIALAGCLGPTPTSSPTALGSPPVAQVMIEEGHDELGKPGYGTVLGRIHDESFIPVSGAHVSILGTANYTVTDGYGRFLLRNVPPGEHVMRVDHPEFHTAEVLLDVPVGRLARVQLELTIRDPALRDARQHFHNYWRPGEESREVFNGSLGRTGCGDDAAANTPCLPRAVFDLGFNQEEPRIVLPGTYEVEVQVTWDPQRISFERVGLAFAENQDLGNHPLGQRNWSMLNHRTTDRPFRIQTAWEMTDAGHQEYSSWIFMIVGRSNQEVVDRTLERTLEEPEAEFHVKVVLHRGVLQLEPPHPEPWHAADHLEVLKSDAGIMAGNSGRLAQCPTRTIPPGTAFLKVVAVKSRPATVPFEFLLEYKLPQDIAVSQGTRDCRSFDQDASVDWRVAADRTVSGDGRTVTWKIPLTEDDTDGLYDKRSRWAFSVDADDRRARDVDQALHYAAESRSMGYSLQVTAYQETSP